MTKPKRLTVYDYKMLSKKSQYCDDSSDIFSGEISKVIAYLQDILDEGFTHLETDKRIEYEYGSEYAVCETKYYKIREENDEEYQKRCEDGQKKQEKEKVRKEARKKVLETLTPEQIEALGIR